MEKDVVLIINTNRKIRNHILAGFVFIGFALLGLWLFSISGLLAGCVLGVLTNMINGMFQGVKVWNTCEKDYQYLVSKKGYASSDALSIISKSFNKCLPDSFHQKVAGKFPTLDEVVTFYTGALPEGTTDEQWAVECLEKTTIERHASGSLKTRTKL